RRQRTSNAITISKAREFVGPRADVRNREETQKDDRNTPGVARHVLLAWRDEDDVARLDRELAALGMRRPLTGQYIDAFLELAVEMRSAWFVAGLRHRDFRDAEGHAGSDLSTHRLERGTPRQCQTLRLGLLEQTRHQPTCLSCLSSALPPCTASSWRKIAAASRAMASAISPTMRWPFSALACCGAPNQPVGAIERMSVSTGWELRVRPRLSHPWAWRCSGKIS